MGMDLFEGSDDEDLSKIVTNAEYDKRYKHNKEREDLHRLQELKKKGFAEDSEESSSEDEDEDMVGSSKMDLNFLVALNAVKNKDPIIEEKDLKLFGSDDEESEDDKDKRKKEKPMYLKDVLAKHLIEEGAEFEEKETKKTYKQEQDEFRDAFLTAVKEPCDDDDGDLLVEKKKHKGGDEDGNEDSDEVRRKLDEYFGEDERLNENDRFLKNFIRDKGWIDKEKGLKPDPLPEISEDEEEIEKQEKYEAAYNFRYEEGAGDRVLGHARFTEGSVRKKTNSRKLQRKSKEERMALAEFERKQELKHLKNLKKKEIKEKVAKINAIAGITEGAQVALDEKYLEEDFDPEEYDKKMKQIFDDDYYEAEDDNPLYGNEDDDDDLERPDFDKEDEILGLPKDWDVVGSSDGFAAEREKVLNCKANKVDTEISWSDADDGDQQEEDDLPEEGKRKRKRKLSLREKLAYDEYMEEYYKLDYEDTIGDLKTRFRYASVPSKRFGLTGADILTRDDKELNQYVPLKKIAPYTEKEFKVSKSKRYHFKNNKLVSEGVHVEESSAKPHCLETGTQTASSKTTKTEQDSDQVSDLNGDVEKKSRQKKRKERQAEVKPSHGRLIAYGKIPSKSKGKKKH